MEAVIKLQTTTPIGLLGAPVRDDKGNLIGIIRAMRLDDKCRVVAEMVIHDLQWAKLLKESASTTLSVEVSKPED